MNGIQFLRYLTTFYHIEGQILFNQYTFNKWLNKSDGTTSFQFNGCLPKKSVPQNWLLVAKDQLNAGVQIDRDWFRETFNVNDCRVSVALWLLTNH